MRIPTLKRRCRPTPQTVVVPPVQCWNVLRAESRGKVDDRG